MCVGVRAHVCACIYRLELALGVTRLLSTLFVEVRSQLNPELSGRAVLTSQHGPHIRPLPVECWGCRWAAVPTPHLHACQGSEPWSSHFRSKHFNHRAIYLVWLS